MYPRNSSSYTLACIWKKIKKKWKSMEGQTNESQLIFQKNQFFFWKKFWTKSESQFESQKNESHEKKSQLTQNSSNKTSERALEPRNMDVLKFLGEFLLGNFFFGNFFSKKGDFWKETPNKTTPTNVRHGHPHTHTQTPHTHTHLHTHAPTLLVRYYHI